MIATGDLLTDLPATWASLPLKALFRVVGGSTPKSDVPEYWDGDVVWVSPTDLSDTRPVKLTGSLRTITEAGLASCGTTLVPAGSIILSTRAPIGSLGIAEVPLCTNQGCKSLVPQRKVNSSFYSFLLSVVTEQLRVRGKGTTFLELSSDELGSFKVPVPSPTEQTAIADFLDRETGKIDALVEEQRRLIDLLKEKRQAVISHAVTKGLDPNAKTKLSGADWLGNVPERWSVEKAKRLFIERDERSPSGEETLLTVSHLTGVTPRAEKNVTMTEAETTEGYKLCFPGDLVINTLWAWMGAMGVTSHLGIVSPAYNVYTPNERLLPSYVNILVQMPAFAREVERYSKGVWSSRLRLYPAEFFQVLLPVPLRDEQGAIVDHVEKQTSSYASLIAEAEGAIGLLAERRAALISAAVTGKIDVREFAEAETAAA